MRTGFSNPMTKLSVKQQLLLLFLLMVSPIFILHSYGNSEAEQILKRHVTNAYAELNKQNHTLIDRDIDTVNKITTTIIQNPTAQQLVPDDDETVIERVRKYEKMDALLAGYSTALNGGEAVYYSLYIYDPNNYYFFAPKVQMIQSGVYFFSDANKPKWFDKAVGLKGQGFMEIIENNDMLVKKRTLAYIRAVNTVSQGHSVIGVLIATNMDKKLAESMQSVSLPGGEIFFTDKQNYILASTSPRTMGSTVELPVTASGEAESLSKPIMTSEYIYMASDNELLQQRLIYKIPIKSLLQQQNEVKRVIQLISVAYILFGCIVIFYFWRSLMTPLQRLATFVRRYEPGKRVPETPGKGRNDEVGVLIGALYDMARRLNGLIHDKYQMEIKQRESQLQILYQQINPHLLYNTLESIYWKSSLEGNSESAEMIKELSKLMKISLSRGRELITLAEELEHAAAYVKLQQKRYDYDFRVIWAVPEEMMNHLIPKVTLQPLIENAIIHGVKNMGEDGEIHINAEYEGDKLLIRVEDNGYKEVDHKAIESLLNEPAAQSSSGYGVKNIHQRLQLHFGNVYGIQYKKRNGGGTIVTIQLPAAGERKELGDV
ncbi:MULTISPECIES: sensor histidine kinase [unclassified Paenibacillus]|uniref:cache domain-containing sensor histidine kinase n=1 Tax=unclassified Paenibacillus TaxID=185978 RepID=UPI00104C24C4|nr:MULTISPECIES: sensor histidine kinase [unclassified Paenibacillus]NIK66761.1 two-component system sensor histidine kinase YesM [Paenibacillus sp. BK720]TCN00741.1 two-component system sensor histidine kinase YesM [Paenibacillus sp. BK033]